LDFNDEACRRLGYTREEFANLKIPDFDATESVEDVDRRCQEIIANGSSIFETKQKTKSGAVLEIEVRAKAVRLDGRIVIQGVWRDITEQKRAENVLKTVNETLEQRVTERTEVIQVLHDVASMANQSQSAQSAIERCLQRLATYNGWNFGHALLPAADNPDDLLPAYVYYHEDPDRFRRFREVTLGNRFRRGEGLAGRVFASGQPEWATDLRRDLCGCRAVLAAELGIATAIAFPILVREKVAGVLEVFSDQVIPPDERIPDVMTAVGMQLGRVLERVKFEEHLLTTAEDMQRQFAQDLHDDVGQELTGLGLKAATLAEMLASAKSRAGKLAAGIVSDLERTHDKVRGLSLGMLPIELEQGLLAGALEQLAVAMSRGSRIKCKFAPSHFDMVFDSRVSMHLYRIAQEAVANALRHSRARHIRITLEHEHGETAMRIEDDGKGLSTKPAQTEGMGLRTMYYRAGLIGGKLEIGPGPHGGTQVVCRLAAHPPPR
jgi:PAS domain S-box-containing protein